MNCVLCFSGRADSICHRTSQWSLYCIFVINFLKKEQKSQWDIFSLDKRLADDQLATLFSIHQLNQASHWSAGRMLIHSDGREKNKKKSMPFSALSLS